MITADINTLLHSFQHLNDIAIQPMGHQVAIDIRGVRHTFSRYLAAFTFLNRIDAQRLPQKSS